jgi:hypothetical protein
MATKATISVLLRGAVVQTTTKRGAARRKLLLWIWIGVLTVRTALPCLHP